MNGILIIRQPKTKDEFESMYDLRWNLLRRPWNQPKGSEKDEKEANSIHFIALLDDRIVGTVRFHKIKENIGQIRYLAVDNNYQGKGIGRNLMETIYITAKNQLFQYFILNARETAVPFFKKLGYKVIEEGPLLFGQIKHKKMLLKLSRTDLKLQKIINNLRISAKFPNENPNAID